MTKLSQNTVCFYSYKGGTGRTAILARIAHELKWQNDHRIACIDLDIEAPGFEVFFNENLVESSVIEIVLEEDYDKLKSEMLADLCAVGTRSSNIQPVLIKTFQDEYLTNDVAIDSLQTKIRELSVRVFTPMDYHYLFIDNRSGYPTNIEQYFRVANSIIFVFRPDMQNFLIIKNRLLKYIETIKKVDRYIKLAVLINMVPDINSGDTKSRLKEFILKSGLGKLENKKFIKIFVIPVFKKVYFKEIDILSVKNPVFKNIANFIKN